MPKIWTQNGPGRQLWQFGTHGGFRELGANPGLSWLLGLERVQSRARQLGIDEVEAARQVVAEVLDTRLDPNRARALKKWLQIEISGQGRDLGRRRNAAGSEMKTEAHPDGVSGRSWERRYEQPAVELLARALLAAERFAERERPLLLAIAPFRAREDIQLDRYIAAGLADEIVVRLSRLKSLSVLAPASIPTLTSESVDYHAISEATGADILLEGVLEQRHGDLVFRSRLHDLRTGNQLWSNSFDLSGAGALAAQVEIPAAIALGLRLSLSSGEQARLDRRATDDPRAFELYLRARGLASANNPADNQVALGLVEQALDLDPVFSEGYALKGYLLWRDYFSGWGAARVAIDAALECVDTAIYLNPRCIEARYTRIRICWDLGRHEDAIAEGRHAIDDDPFSSESYICMARGLHNGGLSDLALHLIQDVLDREPGNVTARKLLIWCLFMMREYDKAELEGLAYHKLHPADANTAWAVAGILLARNKFEEAIAICTRALAHDQTDATHWLLLGFVHQCAGADGLARRAWEDGAMLLSARLIETPTNMRVRAWLANLYACLGSRRDAHEQIELTKEQEPANGYLAYRAAGSYAMLGEAGSALPELRSAIDHGFRSAQLLRFEELLALRPLVGKTLYGKYVEELERKINVLRETNEPMIRALTRSGDTE